MHVALSHIVMAASDVEQYADARRSVINPAMHDQPGFRGSVLLRPRQQHDPHRHPPDHGDTVELAMLNWWVSVPEQRRWATSAEYRAVTRAVVRDVIVGIETSLYERDDELSLQLADSATAAVWAIGFQHTVSGRGTDYRSARRDVVNPVIQQATGLVGTSVYADAADPDRFLTIVEWTDDATADAHDAGAARTAVQPALAGLLTDGPASQRYDVVVWHPAGSN